MRRPHGTNMMLAGSVALVVGADSAIGAAIVRGLIARDAAKVYAETHVDSSGSPPSGTANPVVEIARTGRVGELARELTDVTLLVNCLVAGQYSRRTPTVGRTVKLIDAFAPVLRANGGGAVVNVLSVLHAEQALGNTAPTSSRPFAEWMLADGLRDRLAAQQTQLLFLSAQLVVGREEQALDDQRALAGHIATRLLHQLESRHPPVNACLHSSAFDAVSDPTGTHFKE